MQLSMNGPSVNLKFHKCIVCDRVNELLSLLNIGSCDLHVLNGAFEQATESCD